MSGAADAGDVNAAWKNGAWDFLLKPFDLEELLATVVAVFDVQVQANSAARNTTGSISAELTPREREVVSRVAAGRLNKQIAEELGVSLRTIKMHRGNAMHKLGFSHVAELVRYLDKNV
jgi:FixJ family two-component response regulator